MRAIPFAALFCLATSRVATQQPADSVAPRDTALSMQRSAAMAIAVAEPPPFAVGARLSDLLVARRGGLLVSPAGGALGSTGRFRIRGPQTIFGERMPLVILDGMRLDLASDEIGGAGRLEDLNPEEIASIEVIPGAASTAIYGPGASNGVLIIKTRDGQQGSPRLEAYGEAGVRQPYREWQAWHGGIDADNSSPYYRGGGCALPAVAAGSCIQDSTFSYNPYPYSGQLRTAVARQYGVAVSGGLPKVDYFLSGELDGDGGLMALSSDEVNRLTALGQPPRHETRHPEHFGGARLRANVRLRPWSRLDVAVHLARITNDLRLPTPAPNLRYDPFPGDWFQVDSTETLRRWLGQVDAEWRPLAGLSLRGAIGKDRALVRRTRLQRWYEGPRSGGLSPATGTIADAESGIDAHATSLSAAYEFGSVQGVSFRTRIGYEHSSLVGDSTFYLAALQPGTTTVDSSGPFMSFQAHGELSTWGVYVQQQVDVKGRFGVTAGLRHDDFEYFTRAATYPSLAVSWLLGSTRVRLGYGSAGSRQNAPQQERTKELTAGVEASFFADRVQVGVTLYDMRSNVRVVYPPFPGGPPPPIPFPGVHITNRGIEIAVSSQVIRRAKEALTVTLSAWGNRNRVADMQLLTILAFQSRYVTGYPAGGYWARRVTGFNDANNDGIIVASEVTANPDAEWVGTPYPTQGAALTADLTLRGRVRLGATLDYQAGHTAFNQVAWTACAAWQCQALVDPATPLAQQAQAVAALSSPLAGFFEDADFLKLREVWISVAAPPGIAAALRARSATIALVGRNLRTWTSYTGIDPEPVAALPVAGAPESIADRLIMPRLPEWSLRLRLTY